MTKSTVTRDAHYGARGETYGEYTWPVAPYLKTSFPVENILYLVIQQYNETELQYSEYWPNLQLCVENLHVAY